MPFSNITTQYWVKTESTYDTASAEAATDAFNPIELTITPTYTHEKVTDHTGSASLQNEIPTVKGGTWSCQHYLVSVAYSGGNPDPGGSGNFPDHDPMILAAFPSRSTSVGTSHTYAFSDSTSPYTLQFVKYDVGTDFYEIINGAWVETVEFDFSTTIPTVTFSGGFATYGKCYGLIEVSGAHSASATSITVDNGDQLGVNALVKFGSEDNSGSGYRITAISGNTITITPGLAGGISDNDDVLPVVPSQTLVNEHLGGVNSSITFGGVSATLKGGKINLSTSNVAITDEITSDKPTGVYIGKPREVSCSLSMYFTDTNVPHIAEGWSSQTDNVVIRVGESTAGKHVEFRMPATRFEVPEIKTADESLTVVELTGVCREASGADELKVVFD